MATLPPNEVDEGDEFAVVQDRAVGVGILKERAEVGRVGIEFERVVDHDLDPLRHRARAQDVKRLRMAGVGNEEAICGGIDADVVKHGHRLGGGGCFVKKRGVRDVQDPVRSATMV